MSLATPTATRPWRSRCGCWASARPRNLLAAVRRRGRTVGRRTAAVGRWLGREVGWRRGVGAAAMACGGGGSAGPRRRGTDGGGCRASARQRSRVAAWHRRGRAVGGRRRWMLCAGPGGQQGSAIEEEGEEDVVAGCRRVGWVPPRRVGAPGKGCGAEHVCCSPRCRFGSGNTSEVAEGTSSGGGGWRRGQERGALRRRDGRR